MKRSRRTAPLRAFGWAGLLLALCGLGMAGSEWVSCGHQHLAGGHVYYHHHLFFAAHVHPPHRMVIRKVALHPADHPHKAPVPGRKPPHRPATVTPVPALFQPVSAGVLLAPVMAPVSAVPARVLPGVVRPAILPARPRGPPAAIVAPGTGREKGSSGCRT